MAPNPGASSMALAETVADVALILVVGAALIPVFRRLRQPRVIAEIVAGIVLGLSLLGLLPGHLTARLFPAQARPDLAAISQVGILLFMFLVGWEMDPGRVGRRGGSVLAISLASIALPFGTGAGLALRLYHGHAVVAGHHVGKAAFVLFVGTAMAITAFPVLARIVLEHRLQLTPEGVISLAAAAIGDMLAWCMLAFVSVVAVSSSDSGRIWRVVVGSAVYALVLCTVARPLLRLLIKRATRDGAVSPQLLALIAAGVFLAAYVTSWIGLDAIFGAFSFGLIMPRDTREAFASAIRVPMEHITELLMPIFFIITGLSVDITTLGGRGLPELLAVVGVACLGKLAGAVTAARATGMSWGEARTVGLLMNTRGLTELVILNVGVSLGVLDTRMFTMMVVMALVTTAMAGPFLARRPGAGAEGIWASQTELESV